MFSIRTDQNCSEVLCRIYDVQNYPQKSKRTTDYYMNFVGIFTGLKAVLGMEYINYLPQKGLQNEQSGSKCIKIVTSVGKTKLLSFIK